MNNTKLYLKNGYAFKIKYSHSTLKLVSLQGNRFGLFRIRPDGSSVYVGKALLTYKFINVEHEFEGLIFTDKYSINDIQIIKPAIAPVFKPFIMEKFNLEIIGSAVTKAEMLTDLRQLIHDLENAPSIYGIAPEYPSLIIEIVSVITIK